MKARSPNSELADQLAARLDSRIVENFADLFELEAELEIIERHHSLDDPDVIAALATYADTAPVQRRLATRPAAALAAGLERALRRRLRPPAELLARARFEAALRELAAPPSQVVDRGGGGAVAAAKRPRKALPAFAQPERLPAVLSSEGRTATRDEVEAIVRALQRGDDDLIDAARARYTAPTLGGLGRALALGWLGDGGDPDARWAVRAAARFPDDELAHALARFVRHIAPRVGQSHKARELVGVLGAMETRASLEALAEVVERVRTPSVRDHARSAFEAAAARAGTTALDLADRLVPDAGGKQVTRDLVKRFERRMVARTTTTPRDFIENLMQRPVAREIATGIVFGVRRGDQFAATFAISGERLVGPDGEPVELDADAAIVVAHPLELSPELLARWQAQIHAQPFAQLERAVQRFASVAALDAAMRELLGRGEPISPGKLRALEALDWQRGQVLAGTFFALHRELHGVTASLRFTPGVALAARNVFSQQLVGVTMRAGKHPSVIALGEIARELATLF